MTFLDFAILGAFIIYAIVSGLRAREAASRNLEEYFLAGRTLPGWKAGISMAATQFAADTPLLVTGLIATGGIFALWRLWVYAVAFLLMGFVLASGWRRAGVITDAELAELRYGSRPALALRGIKAVYFGTLFNCTVLAMVLLAATRIAEPFLLWNQWLPPALFNPVLSLVRVAGVPLSLSTGPDIWVFSANNFISIGLIVLVTAFYSTTGGLRSVVNTDVLQFGIAIAATFAYAWFIADAAGGLGALKGKLSGLFAGGGPNAMTPEQLLAFTPDRARDATWAIMGVLAIQWLSQVNSDGTGYLAQRCMGCKSDRDAKLAAVVFTVAQILVRSLIWLPIGLGLLVIFAPDMSLAPEAFRAQREAMFVRGINELLPPGVKGLMLTGMLAALASTVDTHLNWGASYWTNDIFKRFIFEGWLKRKPSGRTLVLAARASNALILLIALAIMTQLNSIQTAWTTSLLMGSGIGVMLVLRWLWWRITAWGEITAIAVSLVFVPVLMRFVDSEALRLLYMSAIATFSGIAASFISGPESMEKLKVFYGRARPMGFWGPVAKACGRRPEQDRKLLLRRLAALALASVSVFGVLIAAGSAICGSPAPRWLPWRGIWIAALVAAAAAAAPVWIRLVFYDGDAEGPPA